MQRTIYKIFKPLEWEAFQRTGRFDGSPDDLRDGFIHFSGPEQLRGTIEKYFGGESQIFVASLDADALGPELRWEEARGGQLFPHLYGSLALAQVGASTSIATHAILSLSDAEIAALF